MGKKKTSTPEEMTASDEAAMEGNASTLNETSREELHSAVEIEEQEVETEPSSDLDQMREEVSGLNDRHLRLVAEFTNYRRRAENELSEAWTRGQADMLRSFVDGLDDLQRVGAWQAESTTVEALIEGVDLVERKFRQALEAAGVEMIDPVGELFDPNIMEAMLGVPTEDPEEDQKVQDVFQKGYSFKGHLVRPESAFFSVPL